MNAGLEYRSSSPSQISQVDDPCLSTLPYQLENPHCAKPHLLPDKARASRIHQQNFVMGFDHGFVGIAEDNNVDRLTEDASQRLAERLSRGNDLPIVPGRTSSPRLLRINS